MNTVSSLQGLVNSWLDGTNIPYKGGRLYNPDLPEAKDNPLSCMCAQAQALWLFDDRDTTFLSHMNQGSADREFASLFNISRAHSILVRYVNDSPTYDNKDLAYTLTNPGHMLGPNWSKLLDFWWFLEHDMAYGDWVKLKRFNDVFDFSKARTNAQTAAAKETGGKEYVIEDIVYFYITTLAGAHRNDQSFSLVLGACWEIQGFDHPIIGSLNFLPRFGFNSLEDIPPCPADYGKGIVPNGDK
jgi:hypothetical protein